MKWLITYSAEISVDLSLDESRITMVSNIWEVSVKMQNIKISAFMKRVNIDVELN